MKKWRHAVCNLDSVVLTHINNLFVWGYDARAVPSVMVTGSGNSR